MAQETTWAALQPLKGDEWFYIQPQNSDLAQPIRSYVGLRLAFVSRQRRHSAKEQRWSYEAVERVQEEVDKD